MFLASLSTGETNSSRLRHRFMNQLDPRFLDEQLQSIHTIPPIPAD